MVKAIVNPPPTDRRYLRRMAYQGLNVVNGVAPTGNFPKAVGSGIFGMEGQDSGVFDGPPFPNSDTGIFYNDYARDSLDLQQPDLEWVLLRRPGRPLYPGSSSYGIVLIGPSMGTEDENRQNPAPSSPSMVRNFLVGAAVAGVAWWFFKKVLQSGQEG